MEKLEVRMDRLIGVQQGLKPTSFNWLNRHD